MRALVLLYLFFFFQFGIQAQDYASYTKSYEISMQRARFDSAYYYAEQAKEAAYKTYGAKDNNYAVSLNNVGIALRALGQYTKAFPFYEQSLSLRTELFGKSHPNYANTLNSFAGLHQDMGKYAEAEEAYKTAIDIYKSSIGTKHPNYSNTLFNLAGLYFVMGDYAQAEPMFMESMELKKETIGEKHPGYSQSLSNLAALYRRMGNYERAELLYSDALRITADLYGKTHISYIKALSNLTSLYSDQNNFDKAEPLYLEIIESIKEVYGEGHPDYSVTLNNLAVLYNNRQDFEKAEPLFREALAIRAATLGENHPSYASSLTFLANLCVSLDKYDEAEVYYLKAIELLKNTLGENHPSYSSNISQLATLYYEKGEFSKALPFFEKSTKLRIHEIINNFSFLSETEKEKYWKTISKEFLVFNSFALKHYENDKNVAALMLNNQLAVKGLLFNSSVQIRNNILSSNNSEIIKSYYEWTSLREKIGRYYQMDISELEEKGYNIKELEDKANNLEKELSRASEAFATERSMETVTWRDIKKRIKPNEVVIEFMEVPFYANKHITDTVYYVAIVLTGTSDYPELVTLCTLFDIDAAFHSKHSNIGVFDYVMDPQTNALLYENLWKPVEPYMQKAEVVYLSPSGILNKVAFGCLGPKKGDIVLNKNRIHYLNNIKNLLNPKGSKELNPQVALFGGVNYTLSVSEMITAAKMYADEKSLTPDTSVYITGNSSLAGWDFLEGSAKEISLINSLFTQNNWKCQHFEGERASEDAFKSLRGKQSPGIIHLATHGFFFPEKKGTGTEFDNNFERHPNPMYRSGLVLSGANHVWQGGRPIPGIEDGILTAYEVANTYFGNTQLVVLSACETGLGDLKSGEGVYGITRAFQLSGVDAVVTSLWNVPDAETVELMQLFYSKLLSNGNIHESFRQAQIEMSKKYKPFFWASFVLIE